MRLVGVPDAEEKERGSGETTLIPVEFGDKGDATIGSGMVWRLTRGGGVEGSVLFMVNVVDLLGAWGGEGRASALLSSTRGEDGAVDCRSSVLKLLRDGLGLLSAASARARSSHFPRTDSTLEPTR